MNDPEFRTGRYGLREKVVPPLPINSDGYWAVAGFSALSSGGFMPIIHHHVLWEWQPTGEGTQGEPE